jgi:hypothetical protein
MRDRPPNSLSGHVRRGEITSCRRFRKDVDDLQALAGRATVAQ